MRRFASVVAALALTACVADASTDEGEDRSDSQTQELSSEGRRVCSWNIRRLGHNFDDIAKDMTATKNIVADFCDVIAVQEVMQLTGGTTPGYDDLKSRLGDAWDGVRTDQPRPNTTAASAERYAFFWRKSAAKLCPDWTGAKYLPDQEDAFLREPAWTCLKLVAYDREIILASYHAIFGSLIERRREVGFLDDDLNNDGRADDVFRTMKASRTGSPSVVLLGDFNLTPRDLADALPRYKDLTDGAGSTLNNDDGITTNQYDHFVLAPDDPLLPRVTPAKTLDVRNRARGTTFVRSISDHLPIRFVIGSAPTN